MAMKNISDELVCLAVHQYQCEFRREGLWPYDYLMRWTGECQKVCYKCLERAIERGLVECGVSSRTGWLTEKGLDLLDGYVEELLTTPRS